MGNTAPAGDAEQAGSTDYFVFYQDNGLWAWRRLNPAEAVVEVLNGSFGDYLHCIADARNHGWKGNPVSLFVASVFIGAA